MKLLNRVRGTAEYLVADFNNPITARLFFRAMLLLTFFKVAILWAFSHSVMNYHHITLPRSFFGRMVFAPALLAESNVNILFGISLVFLILAFFLRPHYATTLIFFWLTFNLYIVYLPFASGADLVLFMLALWFVPVASRPAFNSETLNILQKACFNTGMVFAKLQVAFIYLISGWDKLTSETWRSGDGIDYVTHLGSLFNPQFDGAFDDPSVQLFLSWVTILFELSFAILVWFDRTRIPVIITGVFFHLF
ncbi:MAG TPA: hypothetical protein VFZ52_15135, partial [Chryseolinea sp.]